MVPRSLSLLALVGLFASSVASAQDVVEEAREGAPSSHWAGLDEWAATIAVDADGHWRGPRAPIPDSAPRPQTATAMSRSLLLPVAALADEGIAQDRIASALAGLEAAALALPMEGWPTPLSDGGAGGTDGFELYLRQVPSFRDAPSWVPTERPPIDRALRVSLDQPRMLADTDAASTFAELGSSVPDDRVFACAFQAYAEAALLGSDVAEAPAVRRAFAVWITERFTGVMGCQEELVVAQQQAPERSFITHELDSGEGGVVFLGPLADRHDRGAGTFLPAVWNGMRQWTRDGGDPHALPDFWWVVGMALERAHDEQLRVMRELGVARYFTGPRSGSARFRFLDRLPADAAPSPFVSTRWSRLPRTLPCELEIEPYGSAYATVAIDEPTEHGYLRIWLEGERGVRWSLGAARIDARGGDAGHSFAPTRDDPNSYLTLDVLPGTREVVIVVTNLGARTLDADEVDDFARSFRLIVDRHAD